MKPQDKKKAARKIKTPNGMKSVNIAPTWQGSLRTLLALLESKGGRAAAEAELLKMARAADLYNQVMAEVR